MVDIGQKKGLELFLSRPTVIFVSTTPPTGGWAGGWSLCMLLAYEFYTIQSTRFIEYMILSILCVSSLCVKSQLHCYGSGHVQISETLGGQLFPAQPWQSPGSRFAIGHPTPKIATPFQGIDLTYSHKVGCWAVGLSSEFRAQIHTVSPPESRRFPTLGLT
jgi:hypothetical protein